MRLAAFDRDWLITVSSKGAKRMFGWTAGKVLGRRVPSFMRTNLSQEAGRRSARDRHDAGRSPSATPRSTNGTYGHTLGPPSAR
jgi:hypothetical protein